ncbi:Lysophospholipase L1 [Salegentibacter agarivorans]|uniref:Lysophospholipase L1 n=1 Tax=Salegentibacter agarivorans TaxID=345907 RepID=A0A1I2NIZ1_9FLAO|nr:SGNH/GDSL hydrolase family protein [Salegentibacter agarivorans]SFG03578.1 Lysophospholipase L1 [Salegentibacter agarivorans]
MKLNNKILILWMLYFFCWPIEAQQKDISYYCALDFTLKGKAKEINSEPYARIDATFVKRLPVKVQELAGNTSGLNLEFQTNSRKIYLKWKLDKYRVLGNMTPLAVNGFDLYCQTAGNWQYMASAVASSSENELELIRNMDGKNRIYKLYFPLYSGVQELEIGVENIASIKPVPRTKQPRVVIYGSSITQGASASRPGMTFTSIISRKLDVEIFNLGFSGSGKMEAEMAHILGQIAADVFILDCVPNISPQQIERRAIPFVTILREYRPDVPILMIESIFRETGHWDKKIGKRVHAQIQAFSEAFLKLKNRGEQKLFYLEGDNLIGEDHEATTDGVHLSDLGNHRMAIILEKKLQQILKLENK